MQWGVLVRGLGGVCQNRLTAKGPKGNPFPARANLLAGLRLAKLWQVPGWSRSNDYLEIELGWKGPWKAPGCSDTACRGNDAVGRCRWRV